MAVVQVGTAEEESDVTNWFVHVPPGVFPLTFTTLTAFDPLVVASPESSAAVIAEELPRTRPVNVLPVPVPPWAMVTAALSVMAAPPLIDTVPLGAWILAYALLMRWAVPRYRRASRRR